ncbi:hypothetical protein [Pseudoalteromonas rubra]|uniref:Curli production assembly/transport component CsgG n=1 Tax=Pseudoalteromonas rubra TaxID=43658 RepID=A0A0U3GLN1_9GAMM|nr:hypothetical protein [Pseudoalteromonas rubra]ALU45802.1 hypothetical protein AT705_23015 [Pseudoalteromonas rubra]
MITKVKALTLAAVLSAGFMPGMASAAINNNIGECDFYSLFEQNYRDDYVTRVTASVSYKGYQGCALDRNNYVKSVLAKTSARRNALEADIRQKIYQSVDANLNGSFDLDYVNTNLNGPMVFELRESGGRILAKVGGVGISSTAKITLKNTPSFIFKAYGRINSPEIWATADYNAFSGEVSNIRVNPVNLNIDFETRFLGISIPGLSNLIDNFVESKLSSMAYAAINSDKLTGSRTIFSLDKAIPSGEFFYGGEDLGVKAKDAIRHIISGQSVRISVSGNSLGYTTHSASLNVKLSDTLEIQLDSQRRKNPLGPDNCPVTCH